MRKKHLIVNLMAGIVSFAVTMGISLFLTPYIMEELGNEAYGFIGLANNFASYASVITVALNSMSSRFIAIEMHRGNKKKAEIYFNSVLIADIALGGFLAAVSIVVVGWLEKFINVSEALVWDVKITFGLVFLSSIISVISAVFSIATFVMNRLELESIRTIISNVIKAGLILILFFSFSAKIYYISIGTLAASVFLVFANAKLTKKLMPDIKINIKEFQWKAVKEILLSGIWNSLNNLSTLLLTGLDLLITNLFISGEEMGLLSAAKSLPAAFLTLLGTIGGIFTPQFTMLYAKGDIEGLVKETKFSIKVFSLLMTVPIAGFIAFGYPFYRLWIPSRPDSEIQMIQILSILTLGPNIISSYIYSLYSINTVTNKLKVPVILTFVLSILSTVIVFILVNTTSLGVYAVAGVSSIILLLRVIIFVPMYAAHNLKVKLTTFYPLLLKAVFNFGLLVTIYSFINRIVHITTWAEFAIVILLAGSIGYVLNFAFFLNRQEKHKVITLLKNKMKLG